MKAFLAATFADKLGTDLDAASQHLALTLKQSLEMKGFSVTGPYTCTHAGAAHSIDCTSLGYAFELVIGFTPMPAPENSVHVMPLPKKTFRNWLYSSRESEAEKHLYRAIIEILSPANGIASTSWFPEKLRPEL